MTSDFEKSAKRAAVEAVERRFEHNERVRKQAAVKRAFRTFGSLVFCLIVLAGLFLFLTHSGDGWSSLKIDFSTAGLARIFENLKPNNLTAKNNTDPRTAEFRDAYAATARAFSQGTLRHWKDVPAELRPKQAPEGTVYHALVPRETGFDLYVLDKGGHVAQLSPFGNPVPLTQADFKKACGGKPYFISCKGHVFVCGGKDLKAMDALRRQAIAQ